MEPEDRSLEESGLGSPVSVRLTEHSVLSIEIGCENTKSFLSHYIVQQQKDVWGSGGALKEKHPSLWR